MFLWFVKNACAHLKSYNQNRRQRVKLGSARSEWSVLHKGVPHGSVLGPLLFNVFMIDFFFKLCDRCSLYNYADGNTISISHSDTDELKRQLQVCTETAIQWLESNQMQVNPSTFQLMIIYSRLTPGPIELTIRNQVIQSVEYVKFLGIHIHNKLSFDKHISTLCKRASQQCNALKRIAKYLSKESKECLLNAFILPNFMYGNLVWHFCSKQSVVRIDKINRKALRIVVNDYTLPYPDLLSTMKRCPLYVSRLKSMATEMFKSMTHNSPTFIENLFTVRYFLWLT